MNRTLLLLFFVLTAVFSSVPCHAQERQRFDGGMMVHTGCLHGNIKALNYEAKGPTFGLGGVLRFHLGNHFRVGGEGYVSTMHQMGNGSYICTSWGGIQTKKTHLFQDAFPLFGVLPDNIEVLYFTGWSLAKADSRSAKTGICSR